MYTYLSNLCRVWLIDAPIKTKWKLQFSKEHKELWAETQSSWVTMFFFVKVKGNGKK